MDDIEKELEFRMNWWTKILSGWFSTLSNWLVGACSTLYFAFIPTGVLEEWVRKLIIHEGMVSSIFSYLLGIANKDKWIFLITCLCSALWIIDLAVRILKSKFVDKAKELYIVKLKNHVLDLMQRKSDTDCEIATLRQGVSNVFHRFLAHISECLSCGKMVEVRLN